MISISKIRTCFKDLLTFLIEKKNKFIDRTFSCKRIIKITKLFNNSVSKRYNDANQAIEDKQPNINILQSSGEDIPILNIIDTTLFNIEL